MQYYQDLITDKSFQFLQELSRNYDFILIGGWAVFLFSHALKSKDIDLIIEYGELGRLREKYTVLKNDRLKKYEIKTGEFDVDIYLPHYSELGVDIGEIKKTIVAREGFKTPSIEILFLLKLNAWQNRRGSAKGQKDELDLLSMAILPEFNWGQLLENTAKLNFQEQVILFKDFIDKTVEVKELGLNEQKMARVKKAIFKKIGK